VEPRTEYYLAGVLDDDSLVGFARLGLTGVQAAKLGFAVAADRWGRGYAQEMARLIVNFGFRNLRLQRRGRPLGHSDRGDRYHEVEEKCDEDGKDAEARPGCSSGIHVVRAPLALAALRPCFCR